MSDDNDTSRLDDDDDEVDTDLEPPAPAEIEVGIGGQTHRLSYEDAFSLGCSLLEKGQLVDAAKFFERLEEFSDRGPRAFIMQAFCEAAAMHFEDCSKPLIEAFQGENQQVAGTLHNAFVSYHVGIRQDALNAMIELVNKHQDLPTLCLLLGDMLEVANHLPMARKCWTLAVHRDRKGGAVARVAARHLHRSADKPAAGGEGLESPNKADQA